MHSLMPPKDLIVENGIGASGQKEVHEEFHEIGHGLVAEMIRDGFIKPGYSVLDVGCGLGRLARVLALSGTLGDGRYYGIDIMKSSIDWCVENYADFPNFHFIHADLFNSHYNKTATSRPENYSFTLESGTIDFIWSTSLFTHMLIEAVDNYLKEMSRVLTPNGSMWNSYLLLDSVSYPLARQIDSDRGFHLTIPVNGGLAARINDPEVLIGLDAGRIKQLHEKHGLEIVEIRNGPWSGRGDDLRASNQDVIIAKKAHVRGRRAVLRSDDFLQHGEDVIQTAREGKARRTCDGP
jgi:SAM-dependent methyltransferase